MPLDGRQNEFWEAATVNGSVLSLNLGTPASTFTHFLFFIWTNKIKNSKYQDDVLPSNVDPNGWDAPLRHDHIAEKTGHNHFFDHFCRMSNMTL